MRHRKGRAKLGRTGAHKRCLIANMLKSLVEQEQMLTTEAKAKELRRYADRLITLAKQNTLASRRTVKAKLMLCYNQLNSKEARAVKGGDTSSYNNDRNVLGKLFDTLGPRFENRSGGYTRIIRAGRRVGDNAETCLIEFLPE